MIKNNKKLIPLFLLSMLVAFGFAGCDFLGLTETDNSEPEVTGSWLDSYGYTITIEDDSIDNGIWTADIVEVHNAGWNNYESDLAEGDSGYVVIKYLTSDWTPSSIGKYNVLRWQNLNTENGVTTMDWCEGYNDAAYFDTISAAKTGATSEAGFFSYFTIGAVKQ